MPKPKPEPEKKLTKKRFYELMRLSYQQRAKAGEMRPSELAMTLVSMAEDKHLAKTWRYIRIAQLPESKVKELLGLK